VKTDVRQGSRKEAAHDGVSHVRRRLAGILDTMSDAICAYDREWRFVYLNPQAELSLRRPAAELLGRVVWEVFPDAHDSLVQREYLRAQAEQTPRVFEDAYPEAGLWFEQHLFPSPEGLTVWARDVTQRKLDEAQRAAQLVRSEQRFRALIENSSDAIITVTADGTTLYASPPSERVDGRPAEQRVGRNALDFVHPDDAERLRADFARVATDPDTRASVQYRFSHADGRWIWIEAVAQNLLHDPAIGGIVVNFRDVTQRRAAADAYVNAKHALERSERHYRALIDNGSDLISILDASGVTRYASPSHERILGWRPEELVGTSAFDMLHPDDLAAVGEIFQHGVASGTSGHTAVFRSRHKDGSWRLIEAIGSLPAPDASARSSTPGSCSR